ncbi:unnamed protein product [Didymodactylos carnosus]|uniref:Uncharacterized protein n=1 Tax=Didymodactylos carnosus TaxID=1234261 RepID=A0A8S2GYX6_9BILA|nr:unnamed protein product [Didymodactylos carnosus]CAF3581061.1 unnamed protein product [Didymodactylos carnosus]
MVLITAAITASVSGMTVALANINKFQEAYNRTIQVNQFKYKADLTTPTEQGGQYSALPLTPVNSSTDFNHCANWASDSCGQAYLGYSQRNDPEDIDKFVSSNLISNEEASQIGSFWQKSYYHTPIPSTIGKLSSADELSLNAGPEKNPHYLNHKIQLMSNLNNYLGIEGVVNVNP